MNFSEAMDKLKGGSNVTRELWREDVFLKIIGTTVKSFQSRLIPYQFNNDIIISDGWLIDESPEEYKFCDIIPFLQNGSQAKLKKWVDMFIFFDKNAKTLVLNCTEISHFIPDFESFIAKDWIEL